MRVPERHLHIGMTHQLPHSVQVNAPHHELRCEIMPHVVPPEVFDVGIL
jgi:hypothetical protein